MTNKKKLIYADDLFQVLRNDYNINGANLARVKRHIEAAPAVDAVEVVHGRWEDFADKHDKSAKRHDFRCSVCNNRASKFVGGTEDWWDMWKPNYCPNCGAKMDGGIEDD